MSGSLIRLPLLGLVAVFALTGGQISAESPRASGLHSDMEELLRWFPGTYDNHRQVYRQAVDKVEPELRQRHTNHVFSPLRITGIPGRTLYAQQYQHYDPKDLYRQRIYSFEVDEAEQAVRLTIYTPKDPDRLTDAHLDPSKVMDMTADDFILKPGCEVYWKRAAEQFEGYLKKNACSYYSTSFGTRVFLNETLILRPDALILHDRAVDAEGNLIFGSADKGPTVNLKISGE
ncbi:CpeT/CpcT family [Parasphingorhabdus marina DSM 22363]|uniref:CpeT/CpcT family n=1 Tax=Parasphingorhabdus marina DSM 22363 TaxID=1123272 RepID=A0A1N6CMJ3_9SPHN|nr:chromophore lyase CpcT/CpeT [Parasphingorhabdus marina]SIN59669.1 CpeT/CpcT family [Parasphingorhabdus marina DSM 22363]